MEIIIEKLTLYFEYPFVRYALIVSILISLCASLLGVPLVLKRFSFIGDGLAHVAFGAFAVAVILNPLHNMLIIAPITVLCAILLLRTGQNTKIKGDAALAMFSVSALAIGYLLMNMFSTSGNLSGDVCTTLFGSTSILTLTRLDVQICIAMSVLVIGIFLLFYHRIFSVTFDESFATATGTNASRYNLLIAIVTALVIVLAMNLVGALLVSALVIFPGLTAMRVFKSFKGVMLCAVIVAIVSSTVGLLISILAGTPVGSTIVVTHLFVFLLFSGIKMFAGGKI